MASTAPASSHATPRSYRVDADELVVGDVVLHKVELTGKAYGPALGTAPVVIVIGGITARPWPFGDDKGENAWWPSLIERGLLDLETTTVLCPAWPGLGSTFAGIDNPLELPPVSVLGLADLVEHWLQGIGCPQGATYIGASLGGLVGAALAARHPDRVQHLVSISAGLRPDGWGTATRHVQRGLVRDGLRAGDVRSGMIRARQLGMLTYRGRHELDTRFGLLSADKLEPPVAAYLDHHGRAFAENFPVSTFLLLSEAIDRFSLGETREERHKALDAFKARCTVIGVPGDQLFPFALQEEFYRDLQAVGASSALWKLDSEYGHDAFLADQDRLVDILQEAGGIFQSSAQPRFTGVGRAPIQTIGIGMIGCGTVGQGVLELLDRQQDALATRYGVRFEVRRIAVRNADKDRGELAAAIDKTDDTRALVADPRVDIVVEVAGGMDMEEPLRAALAAGKPVVTANKALLAQKLGDLATLAQRTATPLSCEAAAAAAIPVLRHLSHRADEVESLMGIVNGTCNFLLTRLESDEMPMEQALEQAQACGLAEADPSADLDGLDAAAKLSILCYRAFGSWVPPSQLSVRGIREVTHIDCDLVQALGFRIRHIGRASRQDSSLRAAVEPALLPDWHLLASVEEEYNAVYMQCATSGDLSLFGKGAGGLPTASAVVGDLIDLAQGNTMRWPESQSTTLVSPASETRRWYVRVTADEDQGLARRIERLARQHGLVVQNRASRRETGASHLAVLLSEGSADSCEALAQTLSGLGRVREVLSLGVVE